MQVRMCSTARFPYPLFDTVFPHRMDRSDAQNVFFCITGKRKSISFKAYQVFNPGYLFREDLEAFVDPRFA